MTLKPLHIELPKELQTSDWSKNTLSSEQIAYAALDAAVVKILSEDLLSELGKRDMLPITAIIQKAIPAVAAMELAGIPFDWECHQALVDEWKQEAKALAHSIQSNLNINDLSSTKKIQQQFGNYFEKRDFTVAKDKSGRPKLGKQELAQFKEDPLVANYLDYTCLKTRLSTFGDTLHARANPVTGRIHPTFLHGRASTGRFATTNPNTQNFPRGSFKHLIKPVEGHVFVVADYSQIELRLIAIVAEEENMLTAYRLGKYLHRMTASKILYIPPSEVTPKQRTCAKAVNFGFIYGQREGGFIRVAKNDYGLEIDYNETKKYRSAFFHDYPAIASWHQKIAHQIQATGKTRTMNGWERDFNKEVKKMINKKEESFQKKTIKWDIQKAKIQSEEKILEGHRKRAKLQPTRLPLQERLKKKEICIDELKNKHRLLERECSLLNTRILQAKNQEKNC